MSQRASQLLQREPLISQRPSSALALLLCRAVAKAQIHGALENGARAAFEKAYLIRSSLKCTGRCQTSSKCHSGRTLSMITLEPIAQQLISPIMLL